MSYSGFATKFFAYWRTRSSSCKKPSMKLSRTQRIAKTVYEFEAECVIPLKPLMKFAINSFVIYMFWQFAETQRTVRRSLCRFSFYATLFYKHKLAHIISTSPWFMYEAFRRSNSVTILLFDRSVQQISWSRMAGPLYSYRFSISQSF